MKKTKIIALSSISLIGAVCVPMVSMTSCTSNKDESKKPLSLNNDNAEYAKVTFNANGGVLTGATIVKVKKGTIFETITKPTATKSGAYFKFWCTNPENPLATEVKSGTKINTDTPVFAYYQDVIDLKNCVGITAIEDTNVKIVRHGSVVGPADVQYSTDHGKNWKVLSPAETITMSSGDNLFLRGNNELGFSQSSAIYTSIQFSGTNPSVNIVGSVMGLLDEATGSATAIPNAYCFYHLFDGAENNNAIKYVSDTFLPSTSLKSHCYDGMFYNCSSLVIPPKLPATTSNAMAEGCYEDLFNGCSSLTFIELLYDGQLGDTYFKNWVAGVTSAGKIIYTGEDDAKGPSAIPEHFAKKSPTDEIHVSNAELTADPNYKFTADHPYQFVAKDKSGNPCEEITWDSSDTNIAIVNPDTGVVTPTGFNLAQGQTGTCKITAYSKYDSKVKGELQITVKPIVLANCVKITSTGTNSLEWDYLGLGTVPNFRYSTDGVNWLPTTGGVSIPFSSSKAIYLKGNNPNGLCNGTSQSNTFINFSGTGYVKLEGNIMGLIDDGRKEITNIPCNYCFNNLFLNEERLRTVSSGFLPATELSTGCYEGMFSGCKNLLTTSALPATDLTGCPYCYSSMYSNCDSLTTAPALNANPISDYCYDGMFYECLSLENAPALPATEAKPGCYQFMFQQCTNLKSAGRISLTTLADYCCIQMFAVCSNTKFTKDGATTSNYLFKCPDTTPWGPEPSGDNPGKYPVWFMFITISKVGQTPKTDELWRFKAN